MGRLRSDYPNVTQVHVKAAQMRTMPYWLLHVGACKLAKHACMSIMRGIACMVRARVPSCMHDEVVKQAHQQQAGGTLSARLSVSGTLHAREAW